ncbi:MAG: 4Fe-4S dicluster domain-containing protein [Nitrospinota bacterium]|nr:4Fe-4S dicluster domain-containing protein [Nitrospinota bacterium]MDH5678089.1 4Fe-4S dicluster domain-containing protein [Nitrospinota bacterium]MDH5755155.1 4Fe-4S dicluster domain-containing protein [Nitrospinota bacterium]
MKNKPDNKKQMNRRGFMKAATAGMAGLATQGCVNNINWDRFFQSHFKEMDKEELKSTLAKLEKEYSAKYGREFVVKATAPMEGTLFGYGLDLSRCIGCRRCVYACVGENNQSRDPQIHWISVMRTKMGDKWADLENSTRYYDPALVPEEGYFYMPIGCQMCEQSACVKVCPTGATWKEPDGIVVVDYDWCIGCRYCMAACPYGARHFNLAEPDIPKDEINTNTHYLGNRPRPKGVVEKCTFCIQRTREGKYPACAEICPVGARKFGNLLDPESEMRYLLEHKRVFRLKEDLNTQPKFYYFF